MSGRKKTGKLPAAVLGRLLAKYAGGSDPALIAGPKVGLDAAAVKVDKGILVMASDPITFAAEQIGWYAVHVNANDLYVSGATPRWFLADVLLPPGQAKAAEKIFAQIHRACGELSRLSLIGGHTELTPGLTRPIVAGFMIGQAARGRMVTADGVRPGDVLVLTKGVAVEGAAVLARDLAGPRLRKLSAAVIRRARGYLKRPGISVGPEAVLALRYDVHAMHDPTEGGVLNGLWEMSVASGLALHVETDRIAVLPEARALCDHLGLDPLRLLASGALLASFPPARAAAWIRALARRGIAAFEIGRVRRGQPGVHLGKRRILRSSITDEILKVLGDE